MKYIKGIILGVAVCLLLILLPQETEAISPYSGKCGDDVTWNFQPNIATLTISGTGKMKDYYASSGSQSMIRPWKEYDKQIRIVVIKQGVTHIGGHSFLNASNLVSVSIPNSVASIGSFAFSGCTSLKKITLPESITSIEYSAFNRCTSLTSVNLPEGITSLGHSVFYDCTSLKTIMLPSNLTKIPGSFFYGCNNLTSIDIPKGVTEIESSAFEYCERITRIDLPDEVVKIGNAAFRNCLSLSEITLPSGIQTISNRTFESCTSLTSITIPCRVSIVQNDVFYGCSSLSTVYFQGNAPTFGSHAFNGEHLTVYYPKGNPTWNNNTKQNYYGFINWIPYVINPENVTIQQIDAQKHGNILHWNSANYATVYQIYRRQSSAQNWGLLANTENLTYTDSTAAVGVNYFYKVVARNGDGTSDFRSTPQASAIRPYPLDYVLITKTIPHSTANILYWDAVENADLYQVYRLTDGEKNWTLLKNTRSTGYKDESALLGITYHYKIRARNGDQMSSMSGPHATMRRAYPLSSVTVYKTIGHSTGNILYWNAVPNAKLYQVYRLRSGENSWTLLKNTGSLGYKDETAESGVKYYYKIVARNGDKKSDIVTTNSVSIVRP